MITTQKQTQTQTQTVIVELCLSNSTGSRFVPATVKEWRSVTRDEADTLTQAKLPNGYFWREQAPDRTGALG
jgi:hypothetical protein